MIDFCSLLLLAPYLIGLALAASGIVVPVIRWINFDEDLRAIRLGWVMLVCCGVAALGLGAWLAAQIPVER